MANATLIIRHDADLRGLLETDALENSYDAETALKAYLDTVERMALDELDLDDVDVERIDAGGATPSSEVVRDDGSEMTLEERSVLDDISNRALQAAIESMVE